MTMWLSWVESCPEEAGIEWTFDPCLHKYWNATHGKFRCQIIVDKQNESDDYKGGSCKVGDRGLGLLLTVPQVPRQQQQNMLSNTHGDRAVFKLQKSFFENFILCNITGRSKHHALPKFNLYAEDESRDIMVTSRGSEISLVSSGFGRRQTLVLSHQQVQIECDGHTVASPICRFVLSFLQHVKSASELLRSWMRFIKLFALKLFYCWMAPAIKRFLPMLTRLSWFSIMGDPMLQTEDFHCYELYNEDDPEKQLVDQEAAARLIYLHGPCVVVLFVDSRYSSYGRRHRCDDDLDHDAYGGVPRDPDFREELMEKDKDAANHAVVCYAYRFVDDELQLRVLDNHSIHGPRRWIAYRAFHQLVTLRVDPLDRGMLYGSSS
uniref:Uncharacterized protein n=1 Tax=Oryza brachyantha TaxID=4533 RepID=J3LER9_ORYBR